jgi:hypothetical protein
VDLQKYSVDGKQIQYMTTGKYCEQLSYTANWIIVLIINSPLSMYASCCSMIQEVATGTTVFPKAGGMKHQQNYISVLRFSFITCSSA